MIEFSYQLSMAKEKSEKIRPLTDALRTGFSTVGADGVFFESCGDSAGCPTRVDDRECLRLGLLAVSGLVDPQKASHLLDR